METTLSTHDFRSVPPLDDDEPTRPSSSDWVDLLGPLDRVPYRTTSREDAKKLAALNTGFLAEGKVVIVLN